MSVATPSSTSGIPAVGKAVSGPRGNVLLGNLGQIRRDPLGFLLATARDYGPVARIRVASQVIYQVSSPDAARHVLQENHLNYNKDVPTLVVLRRVLGNGLFTSDGKFWLRQRRLAQPAFHRQRVATFGEIMTGEALAVAERWEALAERGQTIDVGPEMMRLTLTVVTRALFSTGGAGDVEAIARSVTTLVDDVTFRFNHPFYPPPRIPTARNRRYHDALRTLDRVIYGIIAERRRQSTDTGDLLSLLVQARDEETGEGMSDKQLRDEVATFYLAGHETTAVVLTWIWYLLSIHPDVARRLRAELRDALGGRTPTVADLPSLSYTLMVIHEAMRLYPPVWITARKAIADDVICGYHVPANAAVSISPYAVHHSPTVWENPEGFDPERFSPERAKEHAPFSHFPFGGGPRQCIGMGFALMEAQLVLATLAQRFAPELLPGHAVVPRALATLRPAGGLPMTIRRART